MPEKTHIVEGFTIIRDEQDIIEIWEGDTEVARGRLVHDENGWIGDFQPLPAGARRHRAIRAAFSQFMGQVSGGGPARTFTEEEARGNHETERDDVPDTERPTSAIETIIGVRPGNVPLRFRMFRDGTPIGNIEFFHASHILPSGTYHLFFQKEIPNDQKTD